MMSSVLVFLIVLSILILVHEAGHFLVARRAGVLVEEFGIGLPPRIWGKKMGETIYSINLLPFGGFVRLHGENIEQEIKNPKRAFINKSKKKKVAIILAGVVMNFILAIFAFAIVYSFSGIPQDTGKVKVLEVKSGSPAQVSGLLVGDVIKSVEGEEINSISRFIELVDERKGEKVTVEIGRREGGEITTKKMGIVPRGEPPEGEGPLGVVISSTEIYYPPIWQRPFIGIYYGFRDALFWGKTVVLGFLAIFSDLFRGQAPETIAGPVGIFAVTSQVAAVGTLAVINFVGILSVNLAILNAIPFPALDGGRLAFIVVEKITGRRILPKIEAIVHTIGMIILLSILIAITAKDIQRLIFAGSISAFLDSVLK